MKNYAVILLTMAMASTSLAQEWVNPDGGNIFGGISDIEMDFGTTPPWMALDKIKTDCADLACAPGVPVTHQTILVDGGDTNIKMEVEGSFSRINEPGSKEKLVEIAKTILASDYEFEAGVMYQPGVCINNKNGCDYREDPYPVDQYKGAKSVMVRWEDDDGSIIGFLSVAFSLPEAAELDGLCGGIVGTGGAVASAIQPWTGPLFALASLACLGLKAPPS
ncbi:hypothetical protein ACHAQA_009411 [Verticillium albo-atrum]